MLTIVGVIAPMRLRGLVDGRRDERDRRLLLRRCARHRRRTLGVAVRTTQAPDTRDQRRPRARSRRSIRSCRSTTCAPWSERLDGVADGSAHADAAGTGFAAVALLLAAIGLYGVLAYQVSQRRREIGIRMALGAASGSIFSWCCAKGGLIVGAGAVLGLVGAFLLRQTLQAQLYETGAMDPMVVAAVAAVLISVALVACVLPARRAAKTDPLIALSDQ